MEKDRKAFLKISRKQVLCRPINERVKDFKEVTILPSREDSREQASRCMECGTPFCHWACPVGNYIPEWNDAATSGRWKKAYRLLGATNNFSEITARVCPAPCEYSCVLGINDHPVAIKDNELAVIEQAFKKGYIKPDISAKKTGKKIAIIGSGPAGLAAADQLNKVGHNLTVLEKDDAAGGILRYGIPDFKLDKGILDRRILLMQKEGVKFKLNKEVGKDICVNRLKKDFDALLLAVGCDIPRDLKLPGRDLQGIYFAMDYLRQSNKKVSGRKIPKQKEINAEGKRVVVIGGGDTGADCVGVANRQGAKCITQIEIMPKPPECRSKSDAWPRYPLILKTSTSHQEGAKRLWSILAKKFLAKSGSKMVKGILCAKADFRLNKEGCPLISQIPGSDFQIKADLVIIAAGFVRPKHSGVIKDLGLRLNQNQNIKTGFDFMASKKGVFSAGDCRRGQSLVVWAISEGRQAAYHIDNYLMGKPKI